MLNRLIVVACVPAVVFLGGCDEFEEYGEEAAPPPPDAQYLPEDFDSPSEVAGGAPGSLSEIGSYSAGFEGLWVPDEGGEGEVMAVKNEGGGVSSVRMFYQSTRLGGGYWVIAKVPGLSGGKYSGLKKEDYVWVQGQVERIDLLEEPSSPPLPRVLLHNARVLKARGY